MTADEIKEILERERSRQNISQAEWARRSGLSPQRLNNILTGDSRITCDAILAMVLGLKPEFTGAEAILRASGLIGRRRRSRPDAQEK